MRHMVAKSKASLSVEEQVSSSEKSLFLQPICQFLCVIGWSLGVWFRFKSLSERKRVGVAEETRSNGEDDERKMENGNEDENENEKFLLLRYVLCVMLHCLRFLEPNLLFSSFFCTPTLNSSSITILPQLSTFLEKKINFTFEFFPPNTACVWGRGIDS